MTIILFIPFVFIIILGRIFIDYFVIVLNIWITNIQHTHYWVTRLSFVLASVTKQPQNPKTPQLIVNC